jgi:hypothetical protein
LSTSSAPSASSSSSNVHSQERAAFQVTDNKMDEWILSQFCRHVSEVGKCRPGALSFGNMDEICPVCVRSSCFSCFFFYGRVFAEMQAKWILKFWNFLCQSSQFFRRVKTM